MPEHVYPFLLRFIEYLSHYVMTLCFAADYLRICEIRVIAIRENNL
uniref:Uncharacterized protein n=1 Tax=uncultured Desulfobacterium sp. TaxID=201089 RepID=E1Y8N6_9BACT|nr:unknown protein [uncultured Desulfobacterium sp.]